MRFVVDAQLPLALAKQLGARGHDAVHVLDLGMLEASDSAIWHYAVESESIIVTKDEDFPHRFGQNPTKAPRVIWLRIGNTTKKALLNWFEPLIPKIENLLEQGDRLIEVR